MAHDIPRELLLARIVAARVESMGLPRGRSEMASDRWIAVARVADIDRRFRGATAHADRHQHRLDPIVTKAMRPAELVQHHILRPQSRLDHLVAPGPADG